MPFKDECAIIDTIYTRIVPTTSKAKQNNMFVSGYPTYPSSRGRVYCFYCIIAHRLAMFLLRPKRLRLLLPTLDILLAMPIKLVTRADPRKLILNQTFYFEWIYVDKNPCTLPRREFESFFWEFLFPLCKPWANTWMLLKMAIKAQQQTNIYKHFVINQQINNTRNR